MKAMYPNTSKYFTLKVNDDIASTNLYTIVLNKYEALRRPHDTGAAR